MRSKYIGKLNKPVTRTADQLIEKFKYQNWEKGLRKFGFLRPKLNYREADLSSFPV